MRFLVFMFKTERTFLIYKPYFSKVSGVSAVYIHVQGGNNMARILESDLKRRTIALSSDDIISVVREYQRITKRNSDINDIREALENNLICIPEDV